MGAVEVLDNLLRDRSFKAGVVLDELIPGRTAAYEEIPAGVPARLRQTLAARGMSRLYSHQAEAYAAASTGRHTVVVTPTASGKTLAYNLPVLSRLLEQPHSRALYLFPTKALAQDQLAELTELCDRLDAGIRTHTYDGDTPPNARSAIREAGHVVITNPDMLHAAILPHHTKWLKLFQNLQFVVIDELHAYRGVFGSHLGNVIRRLHRVCEFYGSSPTFVMASATIANPGELAQKIIERDVVVVDRNGAPSAPRRLVFYNPPVVNAELGIRRSSLLESQRIASAFLQGGAQTIVFGRSRLQVEILLSYLKQAHGDRLGRSGDIRGYRGGYLPGQRREIERGLRSGQVRGVVATNALELGIDVGQMQAAVLCGYPGSIASTWQQLGRAGRRDEPSVGVMVCSSNPVDQFLATHPEYFLSSSPEHGLVDPDNLLVMLGHLQASLFEVPFPDGEAFGTANPAELLQLLEDEGQAHHSQHRWFWASDAFPASEISLRSVLAENVVIIDTSNAASAAAGPLPNSGARVIGEMDQFAAQTLLHDQAIYLHEGQQYHVDRLDWAEKKAYVRPVNVDYYTDADRAASVQVLESFASVPGDLWRAQGEVQVTSLATIFKKIRYYTHESIGAGPIDLPQVDLHTTSYWLRVGEELTVTYSRLELEVGLQGLANVLRHTASVFLMCDPRDLGVAPQVRSPQTGGPTIFVYDIFPGGVGLSPRLFDLHDRLLEASADLVAGCPCANGCPSCIGAIFDRDVDAKATALRLARRQKGSIRLERKGAAAGAA
ncbi:MAG: box helicase protein [Chloroflexota bacterium]|jgi:DEAD/DEAH box helicase domain-containing protein|nr:box helicase protein [Chloroflexota bacterium]